ncbi:hypothetical protein BDE36_1114 [Arcticibacter tournemirensis]|uniref:XRE family transcriptional regulator n=1 Tax=Arcticibacter tournemirensis TaxID=699437 RepID=A0A5M9H765_9SPHI|nr:hypothetical protein [Arcticibacter tournemirensis]KAA8482005.1 hypothetical protein F1649_12750 [Arcticibacter tournemirensis]TQM49409.1 hypothetical protein BDE36_1114 [Arcticibacter tournemirensis]
MAKKGRKPSKKTLSKKITAPDLFALNKVKQYREEREVSQTDINVTTELSIGAIGKIENPSTTDKYNFGQLNDLARHFNEKTSEDKDSANHDPYYKNLGEVSLHDFLPLEPLLAQNKVPKSIADDVKAGGIEKAVSILIENGFFDSEYMPGDAIHKKCEEVVQKKLLIDSVRTRLNILYTQGVLDRKKMGSDNTYHYKKL